MDVGNPTSMHGFADYSAPCVDSPEIAGADARPTEFLARLQFAGAFGNSPARRTIMEDLLFVVIVLAVMAVIAGAGWLLVNFLGRKDSG